MNVQNVRREVKPRRSRGRKGNSASARSLFIEELSTRSIVRLRGSKGKKVLNMEIASLTSGGCDHRDSRLGHRVAREIAHNSPIAGMCERSRH